jgi:alpha-1,6-mannosyltransferase
LAAPLFYRFQRGYDLTAVSSKTVEQSLKAKGVRALAHLPFGVPAFFIEGDSASAASARAKTVPGEGDIRILYAGRLDREKGIDLVLEALPKLLRQANIRITIIGRGGRESQFAAYRHNRYQFLGFIDNPAKIREIYDEHHILLAPGPYETFGLGVLEAMARGLVVVGPDQGGTGELLRQAESPFIFKTGDAMDFLRVVDKAVACDWELESPRSRALALRYGTWEDAIGRMAKRYAARLGAGAL